MQKAVGFLRLRPQEDGLLSTNVKIVVTLLIGLGLSVMTVVVVDTLYKDSLRNRSQTIAITLDPTIINQLRTLEEGTAVDTAYLKLKLQLAKLKLVNDDARSIYVVAKNDKGVFTVADSESPDSVIYAPRGADFPISYQKEVKLFSGRESEIDGPRDDRKGTHLAALSSVIDDASGQTLALVGLNVPVTTYYSLLTLSALVPLAVAMGVAIVIILSDRSRSRRLESLRFRSELVSIASHELRTPLTGIRWGQELLLKDETLPAKLKTTLSAMYDSTLKLQDSIEDVLQLASLQNKNSTGLQVIPTNMTTLVETIFVTQKLPAEQHHISLEFGHNWPKELMISCDTLRMKRVLNNLVSNAIKYTRPHTTVTVDYEKVGDHHLLMISDQGIGIPEEEQTKVFSGFYRATNAVKKETNGTGMGLYLSQAVVNQHGGKIWLKSKLNKGTTVYVRLP